MSLDNRRHLDVVLTRTFRFAAAHYYYDPRLSDAENRAAFGKCANRHGHGHNYRVDVTLAGTPDPRTGMLIDLVALDRIVDERVLQAADHRNLNLEVDHFASRLPTTENIALWVWERLEDAFQGWSCRLARVRVHESDDLHADVEGSPRP